MYHANTRTPSPPAGLNAMKLRAAEFSCVLPIPAKIGKAKKMGKQVIGEREQQLRQQRETQAKADEEQAKAEKRKKLASAPAKSRPKPLHPMR
jgi:hypothetical protein